MADKEKLLEPGTLEKTRRNIGDINKDEAQHMMKVLGGEVLREKTKPMPATEAQKRVVTTKIRPSQGMAKSSTEAAMASTAAINTSPSEDTEKVSPGKKIPGAQSMPYQDWLILDKLMMSPEYHIKTDYGFFNFVRRLQKNGNLKIDKTFAKVALERHITHFEAFLTLIKTIIQLAPASYKSRIQKEDELKFRFLRKIADWNSRNINLAYMEVKQNANNAQLSDLYSYTKSFFGMLVQISFLGEKKVTLILKEIYDDLLIYPDTKRSAVITTIKNASQEWIYLYTQVVKGMYPILLYLCGGKFQTFELFFSTRASDILKFTGKSRFDILLPSAPPEAKQEDQNSKKVTEEKKEKSEESQEKRKQDKIRQDLCATGLKILDRLFPDAGFLKLQTYPDLYPYFQPLYEFDDGFNLISPENPLQVTIVLLRILEDLFQGCRNIKFVFESDTQKPGQDSILAVLNEWTAYREVYFFKTYCQYLENFVAEQYTKRDFAYSQYGKSVQNKMMWTIKYYFLPQYNFEKLVLERPELNTTYKPLYIRTNFICNFFTKLSQSIDATKIKTLNASITGVQNPWEHYKFDLQNTVSERLDVLLNAKKTGEGMTATNANLIKYSLCICAVLDWWINDITSPAHASDPLKFYRISQQDGGPVFTVPERTDQHKVFVESIKKLAAQQRSERPQPKV